MIFDRMEDGGWFPCKKMVRSWEFVLSQFVRVQQMNPGVGLVFAEILAYSFWMFVAKFLGRSSSSCLSCCAVVGVPGGFDVSV